jgi:hypothetical protein
MNLLTQSLSRIIPFTIAFFLSLIILRFFEFIHVTNAFFGENIQWSYFFKGILIDLLFSLNVTFLLLVFQILISFLFKKNTLSFSHFIFLFLLLSNALLI